MGQSENKLKAVHFWTHIIPERGHILKTENKLFALVINCLQFRHVN